MPFSHDTGVFNVQGSLAAWLNEQLIANQPPSLPAVRLNLDAPEQPLDPPEWSVHFRDANPDAPHSQIGTVEGGGRGQRRFGIMEVNCWVSRRDAEWRKQLAQMSDAVTQAVVGTTGVTIKDFYADENAPGDLAYRIVIDRVESQNPPLDPNPDIEHKRLLVYYNWFERA